MAKYIVRLEGTADMNLMPIWVLTRKKGLTLTP